VAAWHQVIREDAGAWFAAEAAVASAVATSGRRDAQAGLLVQVAEAFAYGVWYGAGAASTDAAPETRVGATEASGQYLATVAMLALLVRDHLDPRTFEVLYRPLAAPIPLHELLRE
jgi:hypothetical protein